MYVKKVILFLFISVSVFAQKKNINNYKYILVPMQFEGFKKPDKHQTSSLLEYLFNKNGYQAFLNDKTMPRDLAENKCRALTSYLKDNSNMFTTKVVIELRDCYNNVVYTSKEAKSKIKDYKRAYHATIKEAFKSIQALNYKYVPLKEESRPTSSNVQISVDRERTYERNKQPKVVAEQSPKPKKDVPKPPAPPKVSNSGVGKVLYAQPIRNGYQLVNTKPEVVFQVLKTDNPDVFIIKGQNGVFLKKGATWIAQFYNGDELITRAYQVKF